MLGVIVFLLNLLVWTECQIHDLEVTTDPSWTPTGRLNQFNGFATPRPSLLPQNAQMVYASVWAAWSAWSFCSDAKRIRVRACNTVRGFRCLGPNQQTEACDPSTSPILGRPPRPNTVSNDYDTVDPWQEDRFEALKQLYPDESLDEKINRLPENEQEKLRARLAPPTPLSHELLERPGNEKDGAPGATPEKLFGARALGAKAFAVKASEQPIQLPDFEQQIFPDISEKELVKKEKSRGEGTFSKKEKFEMDGPKFADKSFTDDIFGSIEELMGPATTTTVLMTTTTTTTTVTTTMAPTTVTTTTVPTTTTTVPTTTTSRLPPTRVTPRLLTAPPEDTVELVTPSMKILKSMNPQTIDFFDEDVEEMTTTSKKPWKVALHDGEVVPPTTTTNAPPTTTTTPSDFPIPEEISLDTLHALDWMLANMTKAAEEEAKFEGNELRRRLDSSPNDKTPIQPTKTLTKKLPMKNRVKTHRTKVFRLHYGDVLPVKDAERKFPKFRSRNAHRAKIFGIKTASVPENQLLKTTNKKEELVDEINDLKDLMEQLDEKIESRSALMEETFDGLLNTKHEHNSPYRQV